MLLRRTWLVVWMMTTLTKVSGYASWLPCYVDLDPSEVVMHHPMQWSSSSSSDGEILLQIQQHSSDVWQTGSVVPTSNHANSLPPQPYQINLSGTPQAHHWRVLVGLNVPDEYVEDVQYVLHVEPVTLSKNADDAVDDDDAFPLPPKETPRFVGTTHVCEGQRAHGSTQRDSAVGGVPLEIPVSLLHHASHVIVQGAWAKGMEAVTLTPPLLLHLPDFVTTSSSTNDEEEL